MDRGLQITVEERVDRLESRLYEAVDLINKQQIEFSTISNKIDSVITLLEDIKKDLKL